MPEYNQRSIVAMLGCFIGRPAGLDSIRFPCMYGTMARVPCIAPIWFNHTFDGNPDGGYPARMVKRVMSGLPGCRGLYPAPSYVVAAWALPLSVIQSDIMTLHNDHLGSTLLDIKPARAPHKYFSPQTPLYPLATSAGSPFTSTPLGYWTAGYYNG